MGFSQGKIQVSPFDKEKSKRIFDNFAKSVKLLESNPNNIEVISSANKTNCFSETELPEELVDACVLAQIEKLPILTEDVLYLKLNEGETKKEAPRNFSSWSLMRVLCQEKLISYDDYLEYFHYLTFYRLRFLSIYPDDIEKAVFGDSVVYRAVLENIRKLNFSLTLSDEYGVTLKTAIKVVGRFVNKILSDDSITIELVAKIFIEIIENLPNNIGNRVFGTILIAYCDEVEKANASEFVVRPSSKLRKAKIERLKRIINFLDTDIDLWKSWKDIF